MSGNDIGQTADLMIKWIPLITKNSHCVLGIHFPRHLSDQLLCTHITGSGVLVNGCVQIEIGSLHLRGLKMICLDMDATGRLSYSDIFVSELYRPATLLTGADKRISPASRGLHFFEEGHCLVKGAGVSQNILPNPKYRISFFGDLGCGYRVYAYENSRFIETNHTRHVKPGRGDSHRALGTVGWMVINNCREAVKGAIKRIISVTANHIAARLSAGRSNGKVSTLVDARRLWSVFG